MFPGLVNTFDIEQRRINPECIAGNSGQTFDVKRRTRLRILGNQRDVIGPKYKHVTSPRFNEIIGEFIDKNLVACVDCSFGNGFAAPETPAGKNIECCLQDLGWRVDEKALAMTNQSGKGKKEEELLRLHLQDLIILAGNDIDVIAPAHDKLGCLLHNIRDRLTRLVRVTDDSIQGGLHRAGRDLEWLQEIRTNADCHYDGDQDDLDVLPPMRFPVYRS